MSEEQRSRGGQQCSCSPECTCGSDCSCNEFASYVMELVDDQLSDQQTHRLKAHTASCPHCTQVAQAETRVRRVIRRSCCQSAPAGLRVKITRTVYREHNVS